MGATFSRARLRCDGPETPAAGKHLQMRRRTRGGAGFSGRTRLSCGGLRWSSGLESRAHPRWERQQTGIEPGRVGKGSWHSIYSIGDLGASVKRTFFLGRRLTNDHASVTNDQVEVAGDIARGCVLY